MHISTVLPLLIPAGIATFIGYTLMQLDEQARTRKGPVKQVNTPRDLRVSSNASLAAANLNAAS